MRLSLSLHTPRLQHHLPISPTNVGQKARPAPPARPTGVGQLCAVCGATGETNADFRKAVIKSGSVPIVSMDSADTAGIKTAMNSVEISPVNLYVRACSVFPMSVPTVRIFLPVNCLNFSIKRKRHRPTGIIM